MVRFRAEMIAPIGLMLLLLLFAAVRMIGKKRRISKPITVKTVIAGIAPDDYFGVCGENMEHSCADLSGERRCSDAGDSGSAV